MILFSNFPLDNLALLRETIQSGEVSSALAQSLSSRAVDGNSDNNINGGSCSETPGRQDVEWWSVRLAMEYVVTSVILYNRGDCCGKFAIFELRKNSLNKNILNDCVQGRSDMGVYAGAARRRVHFATVLLRPPSSHRPG